MWGRARIDHTTSPERGKPLNCEPRYATRRRPERKTLGPRVAKIAEILGTPFMPWQRLVADVGLEMVENRFGLMVPAYREVIFSVPRQNGKTTIVLSWELDRALNYGKRQRIVYTAQTGNDARKKLLDDQVPMIEGSPLKVIIDHVRRVNGSEGINFHGGSQLDVLASGKASGHGRTLGLGVVDEAFDDTDDRREQAMVPAMATVADAQLLVCSTMGTDESTYLNRKVDLGRDIALAQDPASRIAYFEWSAPDECDIDDPRVWEACMPAYNTTIGEDAVRHARQSMLKDPKEGEGGFRRAFLNQRTASSDQIIPPDIWAAVNGDHKVSLPYTIAIDCNPERTMSTVAVADATGRCEIKAHERNTDWLVAYVVDKARVRNSTVAYDPAGPAGRFGDELEEAGVKVEKVTGQDMAHACAFFYDGCIDGKLRIRSHEGLNAANAAAKKKVSGDTWTWARKSEETDISPLVAISEAAWLAQRVIDPVANVH